MAKDMRDAELNKFYTLSLLCGSYSLGAYRPHEPTVMGGKLGKLTKHTKYPTRCAHHGAVITGGESGLSRAGAQGMEVAGKRPKGIIGQAHSNVELSSDID